MGHIVHKFEIFNPLLTDAEAHGMVQLCEDFGPHGMYSEEALNEGIGEGLPQRFDAAMNFINTGGRKGQKEDLMVAAGRTNYFRETYAYGENIFAKGIEPFLNHQGFVEASKQLFDRPIIEPAIVFANLMLPGQELAVHTDVPEFRGANRKIMPQWLLVVMQHSGLFEEWRMPIATAVSWYHDCEGGEFAHYPEGANGAAETVPAQFNTAILTDTDTVFHGVDRVAQLSHEPPPFKPGMKLHPLGKGQWQLRDGEDVIETYQWQEMRFSISWKAYCFADEADRLRWREAKDDLSLDFILDTLKAELLKRDKPVADDLAAKDFAALLVAEFIHFPEPAAA